MQERERKKGKRAGYSEILSNFIKFKGYENSCTETEFPYQKKKQYILMLKICGIDIFHFTDDDIYSACSNFAAATNALRCKYKYVFASKPADLSEQRAFLSFKREHTQHPFRRRMLDTKLSQLDFAEKNYRERLTYLMLFGQQTEQLTKQAAQYISAMSRDTIVEICDMQESMSVFSSLLRRKDIQVTDYDSLLPDRLEIGQNYLRIDDKYLSVLQLDDFPAEIQDLKLAQLIARIEGDVIIDAYTKPKRNALHEIDKSLDELATRHIVERRSGEALDSETEARKLTYIRQQIANGKEQILYLTIRIVISRDTREQLSDAIANISLDLTDDGISCFIPFNLMRDEYFDLIRPSNPLEIPFPLYDTFSLQYPFYFQSHLDSNAALFGTSITGGLIAIDFFHRTAKRASYDIMLAGAKGSGKSVTLKMLMQDQLLLGNKVLCIDLEGEYGSLAKMYDGQIIKLNKSSRINPLEIRAADTEDADNETNYAAELSRIITFFYYFIPSLTDYEGDVLLSLLQRTFEDRGIASDTDTSCLSPSDFPTLSDLLSELRSELYSHGKQINKDISSQRSDALERLEVALKPITEGTYASMFNGSTNVDVKDTDFIAFNVKSLAAMEQRIYDAQLFNILSLMWQEVCKNTIYNRDTFSPWDRRKVICVIDEAHRFISSESYQVTDFIEKLTRRSRKYEAGMLYASQAITDFNPPKTEKEPPAANKVRTIFSLVQYKMILKHGNEKRSALAEAFPQFTASELTATSDFGSGEMLVSLGTGRNKFRCMRSISELELMYIGNSEDRAAITHDVFGRLYPDDKCKYASILRESPTNAERFIESFTDELLREFGGFTRSDSEALYEICHSSAENMCNELMSTYS